jgi:hypothetical protein
MDAAISGSSNGRTRLAVILLLGTALLGLGAALHPMLPGDLAGELAVIAQTGYWRAIHLVMLAGSALIMIGIWGQLFGEEPGTQLALAIVFAIIVCGLALNASNVAFMAQTGTGDAARYMQGHQEAAAGFARGHADSLTRARIGNALIALACVALAIILRWGGRHPLYMAVLAAVAAIGGLIGVVAFDPASPGAVSAVALFSVWAAVAGVRTLSGRSQARSVPAGRSSGADAVAAARGTHNL